MCFRIGWFVRGIAVFLFLLCLCACSDFGTGNDERGGKATFYTMKITIDDGAATYDINPPPFSGVSYFDTGAVTLESVNDSVTLEVISVDVVGNEVRVTFRVTNDGDDFLERIWLIAQSQTDGVSVISDSADGFIGGGNYYFLQNLGIGETGGDITVELYNPGSLSEISVRLDVVSVGDRIVFQYYVPGGAAEIWSASSNGNEAASVVKSDENCSSPVLSPDGGWIAFAWGHPSSYDVGLARADGGGAVRLTCFTEGYLLPGGFTRDAKKIYVRYQNPVLGTADVYLLDIAAALDDCSSDASLTPLTTGDGASEALPESFPDGNYVMYGRRVYEKISPPYPQGDPNPYPGSCPDWAYGSESDFLKFNLYLKPTDPVTGLDTGPEIFFWEQTLAQGRASVAADSKGVLLKAGGCLEYKYDCKCNYIHSPDQYLTCDGTTFHEYRVSTLYASGSESALSPPSSLVSCGDGGSTKPHDSPQPGGPTVVGTNVNVKLSWTAENSPPSTVTGYKIYMDGNHIDTVPNCRWEAVCGVSYPVRLFRLEVPPDPASEPLPYRYRDPAVNHGDEFKTYTGFDNYYDPYQCGRTGRVVFTDLDHDVGDCECAWGASAPPGACEDHRVLVDMNGVKTDVRCTQAVHDP